MVLTGGPVPLYFQIQQHLRGQILAGEFEPGAPLPTESELCRHFGVSRITVGKALDALAADQLIQRRRGVGTFVAEWPGLAKSVRLTGWLDEMLAPGASFELLSSGFTSGPPDILEALSLRGPAYCFEATDSWPSGVFSYSKLYVAGTLGKQIAETRRSDEQPTIRIIERIMGSKVEGAEQTVVPVLAAETTAERLGLACGVPILEVMRRYFITSTKLIAIAKAWYHPERFRYAIKLLPRPTSPDGSSGRAPILHSSPMDTTRLWPAEADPRLPGSSSVALREQHAAVLVAVRRSPCMEETHVAGAIFICLRSASAQHRSAGTADYPQPFCISTDRRASIGRAL